MLGRERVDILGKTDRDLFPVEQAEFFQSKDREVLRSGHRLEIEAEPLDTESGRRWLHTRKIPLFDERGVARHLLGVSLDITRQRAAEEALRQAHAELEQRIVERTAELVSAEQQLRHAERLNTIGKLAAGIAHELGTPLNVLMGRAELVALHLVTPDEVLQSARIILEQGDRMATLIRHLLQFGRRSGAQRDQTDLRLVVRNAVSLLTPMARTEWVQIQYEEHEQPVLSVVNQAEIEQVLNNVIMNAVQASSPGSTVRVRVQVRDEATSGIVVEDSGSGISGEDLAHIFDPFFTTKGVGRGTGLGLSISDRIVEDHGGRIDVDSREGAGSRFTVVLPSASGPAVAIPLEVKGLDPEQAGSTSVYR